MVDFTQRISKKKPSKPIDPIELYEGLDRASDKGALRPVQAAVLTDWYQSRRKDRDVILKLHTGQGKTDWASPTFSRADVYRATRGLARRRHQESTCRTDHRLRCRESYDVNA